MMALLTRIPVMLRPEVAVSHVTMVMLQRTLTFVRKVLLYVAEQLVRTLWMPSLVSWTDPALTATALPQPNALLPPARRATTRLLTGPAVQDSSSMWQPVQPYW